MTTATSMAYETAVEQAIASAMREDDSVFFMSTVVSADLVAEFGVARVRATPISEPAMTGMAIGAAVTGHRPIVHWRNITFAFNSFDQVANQAAKIRYMFGGQCACPIVFRATCGGGMRLAAQHSQSPYSIFAHIAGLKVVVPSCGQDAFMLMRAAIAENNPVIFLEPARLAAVETAVDLDAVTELGVADIKRTGSQVTIVAIGYMVALALEAADVLEASGISAEVLDPRTVAPLDAAAIRSSVRRTRRLVVVDEAPPMCSMAAEIAASVTEHAETFNQLLAPPARVCGLHVPIPFSAPLEDLALPSVQRIVEAARSAVSTPELRVS